MKEFIKQHYIDFKVRDYMDNDELKFASSNSLLDCSLGTNPFIEDKMLEKYIKTGASEINKYPSIQYDLLKNELVNVWKSSNIQKENIGFGSGTMGIIRNICEIVVQEGSVVLGIAPQFPRFVSEVELKKGIYEYYTLSESNNFKFETEDFIKKINKNISLISLENPNNPTGQIISISDIEKIVKKAKECEVLVLIDEAYGDYMLQENSAINLITKYNNLIVIRSASKFYGLPNHRIGYLFADKEFIKIYSTISLPFPFSDLSSSIFLNIIKDREKIDFAREKTKHVKKNILDSLKSNNYLYTDLESPIFTIKTDKYENLKNELMKKGVNVEDCSTYIGLDSKYSRIRITNNYHKLIKVLKEIL